MAANTIVLKGKLAERHEEYRAIGVLKPGHCLVVDSANKVKVNPTAAAAGSTGYSIIFAKEDALSGKTVTDAYAVGDLVPVHRGHSGDKIQARLAAAAAAVVVGDRLVSAGDGTLKIAVDAVTGRTIAIAAEAVDNSAGGAEAFIAVWIE